MASGSHEAAHFFETEKVEGRGTPLRTDANKARTERIIPRLVQLGLEVYK
ncbi:hypothetical protein J2R99_002342 [Rhodopseudomonas julia]|uniref:Uncharacterized protein n=1 Tax=Rhodopseudomonas julia TaxID=200617 RepID=A0ABU0C7I5_9BRAD|nr:hypothetical protein [Rhodopseudomonas julia]